MAKDPAILFYTSDFISGTLTMTDEQRGKYIILLCLQHQKGRLSEKDMLNICKKYDEDIFSKFIKNSDGKFYNKRMENEILKRRVYSESRRKNRMSKENICKSHDKHMENENIIKNKKEKLKKEIEKFLGKYSKEVLQKFFNYWSESNMTKAILRWEGEKYWDISERLLRWNSGEDKPIYKKEEQPNDPWNKK